MNVLSGVFGFTLVAVIYGQQLHLGDSCRLKNGGRGVCRRTDDCRSARNVLESKSNETLMVCYYDFGAPIVCCNSNEAPLRGKSWEKCLEYASAVNRTVPATPGTSGVVDQCFFRSPIRQKRIIGGNKSLPKEFPHMAALGFGELVNVTWQCAGSLISPRFVLTTANCLFSRSLGRVRWVRLGDINLEETYDDDSSANYSIEDSIVHPSFKSRSVYDNIALLKLSEDVEFNAYVRPACLNTIASTPQGQPATATGWGVTSSSDWTRSADLMKVVLRYDDPQHCNATYAAISGTTRLSRGYTDETMVCAGDTDGHRDTCMGDSGGPLQTLLQHPYYCMYSIVGLTSFGSAFCGASNAPAVYTRVSYYVPWIEGIVWPNDLSVKQ